MKVKPLYSWICLLVLTSAACQMSAMPTAQTAPMAVAVEPTQEQTIKIEQHLMQVCADGLNYRDAPMGEIKHQAERGDVVWVGEPEGGWVQIVGGEWRGLWVKAEWLCGDAK